MFFKIDVLKNFTIFIEKHLRWSLFFNKVAGQQLSEEYCKIFKNRFFHITLLVAASEKFINFPRKYLWRRGNSLISNQFSYRDLKPMDFLVYFNLLKLLENLNSSQYFSISSYWN